MTWFRRNRLDLATAASVALSTVVGVAGNYLVDRWRWGLFAGPGGAGRVADRAGTGPTPVERGGHRRFGVLVGRALGGMLGTEWHGAANPAEPPWRVRARMATSSLRGHGPTWASRM